MKFTKTWKRFWTLNRHHAAGFTLVELIVVIAILAILAGIAVPAYSGYIQKAKEAGDYTLLSAINTAFAAACIENGQAAAGQGTVTISGYKNGDANPIAVSVYNDAFKLYLGDSVNTNFEVIEGLYFDNSKGVFDTSSAAMAAAYNWVVANMGTEIGAVKDSAFAQNMTAAELMGTVNGVTGLAAEMLGSDGSYVSNLIFGDESTYLEDLAGTLGMTIDELDTKLSGMSEEEAAQYLANSTVLNVAQTVNSDAYNKEGLQNLLATGKLGTITSGIQTSNTGLADAALIFGLYTAYAPDKAGTITSVNDLAGLASDTDGFMAYLSTLSDPNSQASKDLAGYYAALDVVNGAVSNDPTIADQVFTNGYTDSELIGMMGSVLG